MGFPEVRLRRLRRTPGLRRLVRETSVSADQLVMPLFVASGSKINDPISSLPGQSRFSVDELPRMVDDLLEAGVYSVLLFGIPATKDPEGRVACDPHGVVQEAVRSLKARYPELVVITDLCFCEYTSHGHCGIIDKGELQNDATLALLVEQALSHAEAGADIIAPSGMLDGMVAALRRGLDEGGFEMTPIMSYSAKFASAYYGPFREAVDSAPQFGDRKSYQMDPANGDEALREVALDVEEGADIIMVKPALPFLDIIRRAKDTFKMPVAAYNVSGEYSMIKAAAQKGWINEESAVHELLTSIRRAGADIILTYFALEYARRLRSGR